MSSFGQRLKQIRMARDMSQEQLADLLGTSKQVISRYETNRRTPKITVVQDYADLLGVPLNCLLKDSPSAFNIYSMENVLPIERQRIPLIGTIAAGKPIYADENFETYVETGTYIDADFCLRIKGDSMIGVRIYDNDIVFIKKMNDVKDGEIAAVLIEDEATLKRVYKIGSDRIQLRSENPRFKPLEYTLDESSVIVILGKAVAFLGDVK